MDLSRVQPGDVVRCQLRGVSFFAYVRGHDDDGLGVTVLERHKLPRGLTVTHVTARQVTAVWLDGTTARRGRRAPQHEAVPA